MDWSQVDEALLDFTARLIELRRALPHLRDGRWWHGQADADGHRDVVWLDRLGREMRAEQWQEAQRFVLGMLLGARAIEGTAAVLVLFNAEQKDGPFPLPAGAWTLRFDSSLATPFAVDGQRVDSDSITLKARSVTVLQARAELAS